MRVKVPIELVNLDGDNFHILVPVKINGTAGDMIIDTGASMTVAEQSLFADIPEMEIDGEIQSGGITGAIENIRPIRTDSFEIGGHPIRLPQISLIDMEYINKMYEQHLNRRVIGLLGSDFCVSHQAIINYQRKILSFSDRFTPSIIHNS